MAFLFGIVRMETGELIGTRDREELHAVGHGDGEKEICGGTLHLPGRRQVGSVEDYKDHIAPTVFRGIHCVIPHELRGPSLPAGNLGETF